MSIENGRVPYGTTVRARVRNVTSKGYTRDAHADRLKFNGMVGTVNSHSDSHGLCFRVQFHVGNHDGENTAWFDPDELEVCG